MEYLVQDTSLTAVADAIREKTGGADALAFPDGMVEAIFGIVVGGDSGEPGGGSSVEEVTITQAITNAADAFNMFRGLMGEGEKITLFLFSGADDPATKAVTDQCLYCLSFAASYGQICSWARWRSSAWNVQGAISASYDLKVNPNDVYKKFMIL